MSKWMMSIVLGILTAGGALGSSDLIQVRHDHDPWGDCRGTIQISEDGIQFASEKEEHSRNWGWTDIQSFDRESDSVFSVLTYADQSLLAGRDQPFHFRVLEGGGELDQASFQLILERLKRPVIDRIPREIPVEYSVEAKHLHTWGGCEGVVEFGKDRVVFRSERAEDSRTWRKEEEIVTIWSVGPYDLEIEVRELHKSDTLRSRIFRFQLKEPLDSSYYKKLRRELIPER